jgi:hypothetical protein
VLPIPINPDVPGNGFPLSRVSKDKMGCERRKKGAKTEISYYEQYAFPA